ncbi:hypothetical protein OBBRIDRAFT_793711 [Obba rivulosa]|uniref:Uncharacterized protein n=1 Tax=Obba rivulosa TaxID=1052685 RepID=A0A8E2AXI6_9APHY|nr:hypothetical protein OBBRIDRAFT_793711 [Obba rivulosa]
MSNKRKLSSLLSLEQADVACRGIPPLEKPAQKIRRMDKGNDDEASLSDLLDFSQLSSTTAIHDRFEEIASTLLLDFRIVIDTPGKRHEYEILELEFYLRKPGCHEDPFTHASEEQRRSGQWYFHAVPRRAGKASPATAAGGYRGGSRKGVDLTLGSSSAVVSRHFATATSEPANFDSHPGLRGGVLLRTVRRVSDAKVISGPSLLVDEVLRASGASTISELVRTMWNGDISAFSGRSPDRTSQKRATMFLEYALRDRNTTAPRVFSSPRIGLDLSHSEIPPDSLDHPRIQFINRPYRYFTHPHLLTANGRGHTFLGVYNALRDGSTSGYDICEETAKITGLKLSTVEKYSRDVNAGLEHGALASFIGKAGKGAGATPSTFLRMMGTLERVGADSLFQNP